LNDTELFSGQGRFFNKNKKNANNKEDNRTGGNGGNEREDDISGIFF
jgi:hypothetical protein